MVSWRDAGETASSTRDQGRASSTESQTTDPGIFDGTWQDGSEDAAQFRHDETVPDSLGQERAEEEASQHVHLDQDFPEVPCLRLVRKYLGPRTCGHADGLRCQVPL